MSELEKGLVFAGVDTHKDTHTLCLLDHTGRAIGTFRFAADAKGYDALAGKIGGPATCAGGRRGGGAAGSRQGQPAEAQGPVRMDGGAQAAHDSPRPPRAGHIGHDKRC